MDRPGDRAARDRARVLQPAPGRRADRSQRGGTREGVGWGLLAGLGFGLLFVALDAAGTSAGAWPLLPGQIAAVVLVLGVATVLRRRSRDTPNPRRSWRPALPWGIAAGLGGGAGNILFFAATGGGQLTVVAVLTALYPAVTVAFATLLLRERTTRVQLLGLAVAAVAVVLISSS